MPDLASLGLLPNLAVFAAGAAVVWLAGSKVSAYADTISERSGLGQALIGLLLLAGVTSLPEIATSVTAAAAGSAPLAVNNLLGSIAMQVALLAIADAIIGKSALTSVVPNPVVMLQGALNVVLLCTVAIACIAGDISLFGAGGWTWGLLAAAIYSMRLLSAARSRKPWIANTDEGGPTGVFPESEKSKDSNLVLGVKTGAAALAILLAGSAVAMSGDAIAKESGIGGSFMGFAFVAIATSLPEASATFAAVRQGAYTLAISSIFGTNILNVGLLFVVDAVASSSPVLGDAGSFGAIAALLGAVVTALFLAGIAERRDRTILRMGHDSLAVLLAYIGGLGLLYTMKGAA